MEEKISISSELLNEILEWAKEKNPELLKLSIEEVIDVYYVYMENLWESKYTY